MTTGYQYGEGAIIDKFFGGKPNGFLVEVGAADGIDNSNSFELIKRGWGGLLIEPNPSYVYHLLEIYGGYNNVYICPFAASAEEGLKNICLNEQCTSLRYFDPPKPIIKVMCLGLTRLFSLYRIPTDFDFLSVDCEGTDMDVLASLDFHLYRPSLVCVEHSMPFEELNKFMYEHGYEYLDKTLGNSFFKRRS